MTHDTDATRRKMYSTWHRGKTHQQFWYEDDPDREAWWTKMHWLYVTRRDLPKTSPYLLTLQEVMDAMRVAWIENARPEDVFVINAEQRDLKWSIYEWEWFTEMVKAASAVERNIYLWGIEWYNIYDEQHPGIHAHTRGTIAIANLHPASWLMRSYERLKRSEAKQKIVLITATKTADAQIPEMIELGLSIPGCGIGQWAPPRDLTERELEREQEVALTIERMLGYRADAPDADGKDVAL